MANKMTDKITRKSFLVLIVLLFVVITGCNGGVSGGSGSKVYVGTKGVTVEFFRSNPTSVFEQDDFAIAFFLKNEGAYNINSTNPGKFTVSFDEYYLKIDGTGSDTITLEGRSLINPVGDNEYYEFLFNANSLNNLRESVKTKINFNMCYPYRTELSTAVCVDTRINTADQGTNACKTQIYTGTSGQGGPIVVTKVEPEMMIFNKELVRPQYKIYVENKGKGYVINRKSDTEDICDSINLNRTSPNLKKVTVKGFLSNQALNCDPAELRLQDDQDNFVRCAVTDAHVAEYSKANRNYVAPLTVVIDYGYVEVVPYEVTIKRKYEVDEPDIACGYYEFQDGNKCVSKCDYCSSHPKDAKCTRPVTAPKTFEWNSGFSCTCSRDKCDELNIAGNCAVGYCSGSEYCCRTNECLGQSNGTLCGTNFACMGEQCSRKTQCDIQYGEIPWTDTDNRTRNCQDISGCIDGSIIRNLCPGGVNWVCCVKK